VTLPINCLTSLSSSSTIYFVLAYNEVLELLVLSCITPALLPLDAALLCDIILGIQSDHDEVFDLDSVFLSIIMSGMTSMTIESRIEILTLEVLSWALFKAVVGMYVGSMVEEIGVTVLSAAYTSDEFTLIGVKELLAGAPLVLVDSSLRE